MCLCTCIYYTYAYIECVCKWNSLPLVLKDVFVCTTFSFVTTLRKSWGRLQIEISLLVSQWLLLSDSRCQSEGLLLFCDIYCHLKLLKFFMILSRVFLGVYVVMSSKYMGECQYYKLWQFTDKGCAFDLRKLKNCQLYT